jgi:hypothetical protein
MKKAFEDFGELMSVRTSQTDTRGEHNGVKGVWRRASVLCV